MILLRSLGGLLTFRSSAVRALAGQRPLVVAWSLMTTGYLFFSLTRNLLLGNFEGALEGLPRRGLIPSLQHLNLFQILAYAGILYIPCVICMANAIAGDGLGFSCSRREYEEHISVLLPLWGLLLLIGSVLQMALPFFLSIGIVDIWAGTLVCAVLVIVYSVWAIRRLNYISGLAALGVFVLSWATLPVFFALSYFVFALPFFIALPLIYLAFNRFRDFISVRGRESGFQRNLQVLVTNPQDAEANHQLGLIHLKRLNLNVARDYFHKAHAIDSTDPDYTYYLGRVFEEEGDWESCRKWYEETYRKDPGYALGDIMREVGKVYLHTGDEEKAVEFLHYFLDKRESDPEGRYWLAVAYEKLGRPEEMRSELNTIIDQARSNPRFFRKTNRVWLHRSRTLLHQKYN